MKLDRSIYPYHQVLELLEMQEDDIMGEYDQQELEDILDRRSDDASWRRGLESSEMLFGIELELEAKGYSSPHHIVEAFPDAQEGDPPIPFFEQDASLDNGVEVIFPPVSPAMIKNVDSYFQRAVSAVKEAGITIEDSTAGMHINVNRGALTDKSAALIGAVVMSMPYKLLTAVGGRELNQYCAQDTPEGYTVVWEMLEYDGHDWAVEYKDTRIELRYPVGTVDYDTINRNITFAELMIQWACTPKARRIEKAINAWPKFYEWLQLQETEDARSISAFLADKA